MYNVILNKKEYQFLFIFVCESFCRNIQFWYHDFVDVTKHYVNDFHFDGKY